eukprot:scaffold370_cov289-Prasinococcus_capsulatus_cf.AAC.5
MTPEGAPVAPGTRRQRLSSGGAPPGGPARGGAARPVPEGLARAAAVPRSCGRRPSCDGWAQRARAGAGCQE